MLKRFLYLDTAALADYVSALEGGLRASLETKSLSARNAEAGIDVSPVKVGVGGSRGAEISTSFADTPQAQFERLLQLAQSDPEVTGWIDVANPEVDLQGIGIGALIDVECDAYIPEIVKAFTPDGGLVQALDQLDAILPFMNVFDPNAAEGLPGQRERDAMKGLVGALSGKALVVGDLDSSEWRVAGQLSPDYVKSEVEGSVRIMGKVSSSWPKGKWKPMLALPGSTLIPREQRRALERQRPKQGEEGQYLEGPALMLDILAIYR
ncbi:hypothetical protein [Kitasatospora sp. NPDC050463]|uniref:DUF6414 family protein n=1 Tax=Kitasatospora sp. NPDC050463 TaxID=3155786 RepID=UPI0033D804A3